MENRQTPLRKPDPTVQTAKLVAPPQAKLDSQFAGLQHGNSPVQNAGTVKRFTISVEDAFKWVDAVVFADTNKHLKDVEMFIFKGSWLGHKYDQIAEDYGYSVKYIQQDIAPKLWKLLSKTLGEPVKKTNFRAAVERQWRSHLQAIPLYSGPEVEETTSPGGAVEHGVN